MKTFIILIAGFLILFHTSATGQWIDSFTVTPANPTTNDTITVIVNVSFPSGSCPLDQKSVSVNGQQISAYALHCLGVLSVICPAVDTFRIDPLPAGNYTFTFQVDAGALPQPCTPGIVAGPVDSVKFTVSPAVGLAEQEVPEFTAFPNPASSEVRFNLAALSYTPDFIEIYTLDGKQILLQRVSSTEPTLDITGIANGNYLVRILKDGNVVGRSRIEVTR
jgi:hypothetical protein